MHSRHWQRDNYILTPDHLRVQLARGEWTACIVEWTGVEGRRGHGGNNQARIYALAVALGATAAWGRATAARSNILWHEQREMLPEGVASGDPDNHSVLLWTRRPPVSG